jgi:CRP/FNR family transcriptional regulator
MAQPFLHVVPPFSQTVHYTAGQVIFNPGDAADAFSMIQSGEVRMYDVMTNGTERLLDILGPEDWVGYAALAQFPSHGRRAVAVTDVTLNSIPVSKLRKFVAEHPDLTVGLIEKLARSLHQAWAEGSRFVFDDCRLRLIKTLLRFSHSSAAKPSGEGVILRITHKQLAQAVGAARETVSVCLTELRHKKIVRTGRNQLSFNPKQLQEMDHAEE